MAKRYYQNDDPPEELDGVQIAYFLGHGDPHHFWGGKLEDVDLTRIHLGDGELRYVFMDSCNVLAHGPVRSQAGAQPWLKPDHPKVSKENVFLRWLEIGPPFGRDLEFVCAGSTVLIRASQELLRNLFNERLSMAEAFLMSHATAKQVPLCLGKRRALKRSIQDVLERGLVDDWDDDTRIEAFFARQLTEGTEDDPRDWKECDEPLPDLPMFILESYKVPPMYEVPSVGGWRLHSFEKFDLQFQFRMQEGSGALRFEIKDISTGDTSQAKIERWRNFKSEDWQELLEEQVAHRRLRRLLHSEPVVVYAGGREMIARVRTGERVRDVSLEAVWPDEDYGRSGPWNHEERVRYRLVRKSIEFKDLSGNVVAELPVLGDGGEDWVRIGDKEVLVALTRRKLISWLSSPMISPAEAEAEARKRYPLEGIPRIGCRRGFLEAPAHCQQRLLSVYYELAFDRGEDTQPEVHRVRAHRFGVDRFVCDEFDAGT